jgi:hypothetical protein
MPNFVLFTAWPATTRKRALHALSLVASLVLGCGDDGSEPAPGGGGSGAAPPADGGADGTGASGGSGGTGGGTGGGGGVVGGAGGTGGAPCVDECDKVGPVCDDGIVSQCAQEGGCLVLTDPVACADGFCAHGEACGECENECAAGAEECTNDLTRTCVTDGDGCRSWSSLEACDGACVAGACQACGVPEVDSCASTACSSELAAAGSCRNGCGVFPSSSCIANNCQEEYLAAAICMATECPSCDTPALCGFFCANAVACGTTSDQAACEAACQGYGLSYPAACASTIEMCEELYTCGQLPPNHCGESSFACNDGVECISIAYRCDSTPDCSDGSDEGGVCAIAACGAAERDCGSGCAPCPTGAEITGYTCSGDATPQCIVGECSVGVPDGASCAPLTTEIISEVPLLGVAVLATATDDAGTRHVLFDRFNTSYNETETVHVWRAPGGSWQTEMLPFIVPSEKMDMVAGVNGELHIAVQTSASVLRHIYRDALGWHDETYDYPGAAQPKFRAGFDQDAGEFVVVQPNAARFLRRQSGGWVIVPVPAGVTAYNLSPSNIVFEGGVAKFVLAGYSSGQKAVMCELATATGSCVLFLSLGSSPTLEAPVLSMELNGDANVAMIGDVYGLGTQLTLFSRISGTWQGEDMLPLGGAPDDADNEAARLGTRDAKHPLLVIRSIDYTGLIVGRWTGAGWERVVLEPPVDGSFATSQINDGMEIIEDDNGWLVAVGVSDQDSVWVDGALGLYGTGP